MIQSLMKIFELSLFKNNFKLLMRKKLLSLPQIRIKLKRYLSKFPPILKQYFL